MKPIDSLVDSAAKCTRCSLVMQECLCDPIVHIAGEMPIALYEGELEIGGITLQCAVLNTGERVIGGDFVADLLETLREINSEGDAG